ncbi:Lipoprotein LipO [Paenibacillus allorhizoplanae]|uniref:Lipoprotein LipO n=1 Tax=Paenibacillus allorhizoplanae TaxID=2905648 RepID=A0ABM9CUJ5_9BACL|nr:extracellular solute-binding protein [Paenibacillus allorhizoplanae]CAH1223171.1 Lipoprotein LipO [Paenibacillus allorhizoplanae]
MGKQRYLLALAVIMVFSLVTACSQSTNSGEKDAGNSPTSAAQKGASADAIQKGTYKFETPVTITTVKATDATMKFKNGETMENNVHTKWAHDQLGVDLKVLWQVPGEQFNTKLRLMLTANESLPDVLTTQDMTLLDELIQSGKYRDITADFEKYASPKMKQIYNANPLNWSQVTYGGKKMALPNFATAGNDNPVMWVRQDWLDKLGIKAPKTFEELEAVMQAFLDKKPGGSDNVIPLGASLGSGGSSPNPFTSWLGETSWVFGALGTVPYQWLEKDGKLVHGSTLPAMKDGLAKLRDWYNKGYLSKEAGLHDENKLAELIAQGRVGIVVAPSWMSGWPNTDMQKNVAGSIMKPYPLPTLNGKIEARDTTYLRGGLLVKKDFEHVDALFLYLNRIFSAVNPEEGSEFVNGWAKDYDYTIKADGTYSVTEGDIPGGKVSPAKYLLIEPKDPFIGMKLRADVSRGKTPVTPSEKKIAVSGQDGLKAAEIVDDGWKAGIYIPQAYTGANTPAMQSKGGILVKLEGDTFINIIYGKKPVTEFDNFVKEWKSLGGDDMTKEVNDWYSKMKK